VASLVMMNLRVAAHGKLRALWVSYLALAATALATLGGAAAVIEMVYHLQLDAALGNELRFMGTTLNAKGIDSWVGAAFVAATGAGLFELSRRRFALEWSRVQTEIQAQVRQREGLA
jgi:branched-chain amino acid transport system permease protein